ncbi:expressed unknown protein [Seminavis robusta]|uniref:Uncharacterized protein n=1 Tax=Seminavis robusta TaxID=568900 RepID=A0A9N8DXN8_9STRA|nr:expressed unknown protein [Seminavis robusta]|eukprot:Sro350_g123750.1 n/a (500) ;mRNA; r:46537-48036
MFRSLNSSRMLVIVLCLALISVVVDYQDNAILGRLLGTWKDYWNPSNNNNNNKSEVASIAIHVAANKSRPIQSKESTTTTTPLIVIPPAKLLAADRPRPNLWIHVATFAEGLASWKIAFTSLLSLAKYANGTLVEPCIKNGRLQSCRHGTALRMGQIYDLERVRQIYPHVVSYEEFEKATGYHYNTKNQVLDIRRHPYNNNTYHACLVKAKSSCTFQQYTGSTAKGGDSTARTKATHEIPSTWQERQQPVLEAAIRNSRHSPTLLEIPNFTRRAFRFWKDHTTKQLIQDTLGIDSEHLLHFQDYHTHQVEQFLTRSLQLPPGTPYAALQWRPELMHEDYLPCAQAILEARDLISKQDDIHHFVLLSPLSLVPQLQWGGVAREAKLSRNTSYPSLQLLLDSGFTKLEQVLGDAVADVPDEVFLVIWEFLLAQKATTFATCSDCPDTEFCSKCNWQGRASKYAIHLRATAATNNNQTAAAAKTHTCWPSRNNSTQEQQQDS